VPRGRRYAGANTLIGFVYNDTITPKRGLCGVPLTLRIPIILPRLVAQPCTTVISDIRALRAVACHPTLPFLGQGATLAIGSAERAHVQSRR